MSELSNELSRITDALVTDYIKEVVDKRLSNLEPVTVSVKGLVKMTGMSESWLRQQAIDTPEFISIEVDLGSKRLWQADKVADAWNAYINHHGLDASRRLPSSIIRAQKRGALI
ncbi:hypothetical protein [Lentilactobacillus sp. SPB1-3]|uniref:Uncharacterized protein n=1 Tax=Lentilactobacillus terminaliae TaxID=3003483 RepID=A0ACD5DD08_9LACO|nr:hypothetical protein [Lentilactobacillus sp. SPB1-3]MCZ0978002.1 hypothetical protein [Lentilactobacillus sp. SPB1-3]